MDEKFILVPPSQSATGAALQDVCRPELFTGLTCSGAAYKQVAIVADLQCGLPLLALLLGRLSRLVQLGFEGAAAGRLA